MQIYGLNKLLIIIDKQNRRDYDKEKKGFGMSIGEYIKQYRESHRISQRSFAQKAGLSNGQISFLERGYGARGEVFEPTFDTLRKCARAMDMTTEALLSACDDFNITLKESDISPDEEIAYLLFNGEKVTQAQIDEVKAYARWILERDRK